MRFRHLDYPRAASVAELGAAALDDLLDRGDLEAWRPIASEIARDPWSITADTVLRLCAAHPMYGTSVLWRDWIERRRGSMRAEKASTLAEARMQAGLTQNQIAQRLGISQADVSKLERRGDIRMSTLHAYARALGATLQTTLQWHAGGPPTPIRVGAEQRHGIQRARRAPRATNPAHTPANRGPAFQRRGDWI